MTQTLRAYHMPADDRAEASLVDETMPNLYRRAGIELPEIVRTQYLADNRCVMVMDDDAIARKMSVNLRAQFLSGYPTDVVAIRGDVLFMGEEFIDFGLDLVSIPQHSLTAYLQNDEVKAGYPYWLASESVQKFLKQYGLIKPKKN